MLSLKDFSASCETLDINDFLNKDDVISDVVYVFEQSYEIFNRGVFNSLGLYDKKVCLNELKLENFESSIEENKTISLKKYFNSDKPLFFIIYKNFLFLSTSIIGINYDLKNFLEYIKNIEFYKKDIFKFKNIETELITEENFLNITGIICENCSMNELLHLEEFKNLKFLNCSNNNLTKIYINNLESLNCSYNNIKTLKIDKISKVFCKNNLIKKLIFSKKSKCDLLDCSYNKIKKINFNLTLQQLYCNNNKLTEIKTNALTFLNCSDNNINKINFDTKYKVNILFAYNNNFSDFYIPYYMKILKIYNKNLKRIYVFPNLLFSLKKMFFNQYFLKLKKVKLIKIGLDFFLKKISQEEINNNEICCICLEPLQENICETSCKHLFHFNCLKNLYNTSCPYCRQCLCFLKI